MRQTQRQNRNLERLLTTEIGREDYAAFSRIVSNRYALPGTRAFWPTSVVDYTAPHLTDIAHGYDLTANNGAVAGYTGLIPYIFTDGVNQSCSRADAPGWADIIGNETIFEAAARGLTFISWVRFTNAIAADESIMSKWTAGGNQKAYRLWRHNSGILRGQITTDGATNFTIDSTGTLADSLWYHVALQYNPSTKLSVWINGVETTIGVAVPATIFNSNSIFELGAANAGTVQFMDGRQSMASLHANFLSNAIIATSFEQERALYGV